MIPCFCKYARSELRIWTLSVFSNTYTIIIITGVNCNANENGHFPQHPLLQGSVLLVWTSILQHFLEFVTNRHFTPSSGCLHPCICSTAYDGEILGGIEEEKEWQKLPIRFQEHFAGSTIESKFYVLAHYLIFQWLRMWVYRRRFLWNSGILSEPQPGTAKDFVYVGKEGQAAWQREWS